MIEQFAAQMPGAPFSYVLKMFDRMSRNSDLFFPGLLRNMIVRFVRTKRVSFFLHEQDTYGNANFLNMLC